MMDFAEIKKELTESLLTSDGNFVQPDDAISEDLIGLRMYDAPLFGVARADDPLFVKLKDPAAIGENFMLSDAWLPGAKSVISFFLPITEQIRKSNAQKFDWPSDEWQHARVEGQMLVDDFCRRLAARLEDAGYSALAPSLDKRFAITDLRSNWSERHVAFVCGLGTFGMSRGLITEKGVAGRFGSVITDLELPATERPYSDIYEYCTRCGVCAAHCPAQAIDKMLPLDEAKSHPKCSAFLGAVRNAPPQGKSQRRRYGCGKCQVAAPCECRIPVKIRD